MHFCLVLCRNELRCQATTQWLVKNERFDKNSVIPVPHSIVDTTITQENFSQLFDEISDWLEFNGERLSQLDEILTGLIFTDFGGPILRPYELNPLIGESWTALLGMLILAHPEYKWVFESGYDPSGWDELPLIKPLHFAQTPEQFHSVIKAHFSGIYTHLDGSGLRRIIKERPTAAVAPQSNPAWNPYIGDAISIDDESEYAWFHAYTLYRFGADATAITTYAGMEWINKTFKEHFSKSDNVYAQNRIIIDDQNLNFIDRPAENSLSSMGTRKKDFCGIYRSDPEKTRHLLISTAPTEDPNTLDLLYKPVAGRSELVERLKLKKGYAGRRLKPPNDFGHSAPGRVLHISNRLLKRTRGLTRTNSVLGEIYASMLANEAFELLNYLTPTTSATALRLRHKYEVLAECHFVGVKKHLYVNDRLCEIESDVKKIIPESKQKKLRNARVNDIELSFIGMLVSLFRAENQLEEENLCLKKLRVLECRATKFPTSVLVWYANQLFNSPGVFIGIWLPFWITMGACIYSLLGVDPTSSYEVAVRGLYEGSVEFGKGGLVNSGENSVASPDKNLFEILLTMLKNLGALEIFSTLWVGFSVGNFGLIIALIYSKVSRR
jgi:hypothetical protein